MGYKILIWWIKSFGSYRRVHYTLKLWVHILLVFIKIIVIFHIYFYSLCRKHELNTYILHPPLCWTEHITACLPCSSDPKTSPYLWSVTMVVIWWLLLMSLYSGTCIINSLLLDLSFLFHLGFADCFFLSKHCTNLSCGLFTYNPIISYTI